MKRCLSAIALCLSLLASAAFVLVHHTHAKENLLKILLDLPAPPPPNPIWSLAVRTHEESFYDKKNPPSDNSPIEDLIDYWERQSQTNRRLYFQVSPSERVVERLVEESRRNPNVLPRVLSSLPPGEAVSNAVKEAYDKAAAEGSDKDRRNELKNWLTLNTPMFAGDVERGALKIHDADGYLTNQEELLTLSNVDFDRARPLIDRLLADNSQPVSQVLAKWALYRRAIKTDSIGDVDRYRDELIKIVEDRSVPYAARDLANDALVQEKEWPGRDEWFYSMMADETFVGMPRFTGITSLVLNSPPDKYVSKMVEFLGGSNKTVRTAAAKNLVAAMQNQRDPAVIKALLPWLENPTWINDDPGSRMLIVNALQSMQIPESVPRLIKVMDERSQPLSQATPAVPDVRALRSGNSMNAIAMQMNSLANTTVTNTSVTASNEAVFPFRYQAISALAMQKDLRAVPALRRVFTQVDAYQRDMVVRAIFACHGFSAQEQLDALEAGIKIDPDETVVSYNTNRGGYPVVGSSVRLRPVDMTTILASVMTSTNEVDPEVVRFAVARIQELDKKDSSTADGLRRVVVNWQADAVDALLLADLGSGKAEPDAILRLLANRKQLREKLPNEVYGLRSGPPVAVGIASCLLEDAGDYDSILASSSNEAKTALFACGRLIRAQIRVAKAAESLRSDDQLLKTAAERFLVSEDSPEARGIVLSLHPGEAKIMGARAYFEGKIAGGPRRWLWSLLGDPQTFIYGMYGDSSDVPNDPDRNTDKKLQDEVKSDSNLLGLYAYDNNFVRIYHDRVMYSWSDDASRYHERQLSGEEFSRLKDHLVQNNVDDLKPFLGGCRGGCEPKELIMLGRNGGRRVFTQASPLPDFFVGLEKLFAEFKLEPSVIKYELSKSVPGLEILMADDDLVAETVWAKGPDIRVLLSSKSTREKVDQEVGESTEDNDETDVEEAEEKGEKLRQKREWEGYSWRQVGADGTREMSSIPIGFERPPLQDALPVRASEIQWKARSGYLEIRVDDQGLYKVSRGKLTKLKDGNYESPVVTPNGRWVVAAKYTDEGPSLVRISLVTGKEFSVGSEDVSDGEPAGFVSSLNRVLIATRYQEDYEDSEPETGSLPGNRFYGFSWLDPETGVLIPAVGELRPLAEQTFRPLQTSSRPNQVWAALPANRRKDTLVGLLDTRTFKFTTVVKVPKLTFGSMDMWVDETEGKIYFVYEGHLLSLPLKAALH